MAPYTVPGDSRERETETGQQTLTRGLWTRRDRREAGATEGTIEDTYSFLTADEHFLTELKRWAPGPSRRGKRQSTRQVETRRAQRLQLVRAVTTLMIYLQNVQPSVAAGGAAEIAHRPAGAPGQLSRPSAPLLQCRGPIHRYCRGAGRRPAPQLPLKAAA